MAAADALRGGETAGMNVLIFWAQRLVFLANTKTGSTSIEAALEQMAHVAIRRPPELKHMTARRYRQHMRPLLEKPAGGPFSTVAVMREPIDWLGSWYRYRSREALAGAARSSADMTFSQFVEAYLSDDPPLVARVGRQSRFLGDDDGKPLVDRIFRYEEIGGFVHHLEDIFGCEITLPRLNVSPTVGIDLSGDLRRRLRDHFAPDYAIYDSLSHSTG
jgi:hypothetical protein